MSLQVWLPFNNTIQNQGLNGDYALQAGTTAYTTGLITPKCLNVISTTSALKYPLLADGKSYSVSGWFKVTAYSSYNTLFCNGSDNGNGWYVRCSGSIGTLMFQCFNKTVTYTSFSAGKWFHICVVINASAKNAYLYVNGSLAATITGYTQGTSYASGGFNIGKLRDTFYHLNGLVNDFRIYDHCLSLKEIKELSKGLCLHYKLSRGGENLLKNSSEKSWTYAGGSSYADSNFSQETITPAANSYYTMSFDAKGSSEGSYFRTYLYNNSSGRQCDQVIVYKDGKKILETTAGDGHSGSISLDTSWHHFEIVRHFNSNATALSKQNVFRISGNSSSYTVYIKNAKIEEGDHATSWLPNKSDALYSQLGYNNIEPDCSGYGNDGTITGTASFSNNTPRYTGSTFISSGGVFGSKKYPDNIDSITCSAWVKAANIASQNILGNWESGGCGIYTNSSKKAVFEYFDGSAYKTSIGTTTLLNDTWYLITGVFSYSDKKAYIYVNGILEAQITVSTYIRIGSATNVPMSIGNPSTTSVSGITNCYVSDARVYATALSATDIKQLYNTPISIDDKNTLHSTEFVEEGPYNLLQVLNTQYTEKGAFSSSYAPYEPYFSPYNQTNCKCQYGSKPGFQFVRTANVNDYSSGGRTTYGGPRIDFSNKPLQKGHSYLLAFDYEGHFDTTSFGFTRWSYNDGWEGDNNLMPSPTQILKTGLVDKANAEIKNRFVYAFTINDDIYKTCKTSFSSFVAGTSYLSYRHFAWHYTYATSGTGQGTDAYLTNFKLYDITSYVNSPSFTEEGLIKMVDSDDFLSESKIHKYGLVTMNDFIES